MSLGVERYALPATAVESATTPTVGAWSFDDNEVTQRFDREALCHIPDYELVIEVLNLQPSPLICILNNYSLRFRQVSTK